MEDQGGPNSRLYDGRGARPRNQTLEKKGYDERGTLLLEARRERAVSLWGGRPCADDRPQIK